MVLNGFCTIRSDFQILGEVLMKVASLLFGNKFNILCSCDLISNMAEVQIGVFWPVLH